MAVRSPSYGVPISPYQWSFGTLGQTKKSVDRQSLNMAPFCEDFSQSEKLFEMKPPLAHSLIFFGQTTDLFSNEDYFFHQSVPKHYEKWTPYSGLLRNLKTRKRSFCNCFPEKATKFEKNLLFWCYLLSKNSCFFKTGGRFFSNFVPFS